MYLVSRFRRVGLGGGSFQRTAFSLRAGSSPSINRPPEPQQESAASPQLLCRWETEEGPAGDSGMQTLRDRLFMHWMPVH